MTIGLGLGMGFGLRGPSVAGFRLIGVPPTAVYGVAYSWTPETVNGTAPFTYSILSGSLPTGLSLNASTGNVSGTPTPTLAVPVTFTIRVTDALSATADLGVYLVVTPGLPAAPGTGDWTIVPVAAEPGKFIITFSALPADAGAPLASARFQAVATGGAGYTGATGFTGGVAPVVSTPYTATLPGFNAALIGTTIDVRIWCVNDLAQSAANVSASKTVALVPLLSSATDTETGQATATLTATSTRDTGTFYAATEATSPTGTAAQIAAEVKADSIALGAAYQATVTATGTQAIFLTGLTAETAYPPVWFVHETAAGLSNAVYGDGFTTEPAPATAPGTFGAGDWTLEPVSGLTTVLAVRVSTMVFDGGEPITALKAKINGGSPVTLAGVAVNTDYQITVTAGVESSVTLYATNVVGDGAESASKPQTPWVEVIPTSITVTDPSRDHLPLDIGSFKANAAGLDPRYPAGALYLASGTTNASTGTVISVDLIAAPTPWFPQVLRGRASDAWQECLDRIEVQAALKVSRFVATDTRDAGQIAAAYGLTLQNFHEIRINGSSKFVVLSGVDLGDVGLWLSNGSTVILRGCKIAYLRVDDNCKCDAADMIIAGRGDGTEWVSSIGYPDAVRIAGAGSRLVLRDFVIAGHHADALKLSGGHARLSNGHIGAAVLGGTIVQTYSALTSYLAGDRVYTSGTSSGPRYWWVLNPVTGVAPPDPWASGASGDGNFYGIDQHYDPFQTLGGSSNIVLSGLVIDYDHTARLVGYTNAGSALTTGTNAALYVNQMAASTPVRFQGIRIKGAPNKWVQVVNGCYAELSHIECNNATSTDDIGASAIVTYREIYESDGTTQVVPINSTFNGSLPAVDFSTLTAEDTVPITRSQGTCAASGGFWSASVTVPPSGGIRWQVRATLGALTATTSATKRIVGAHTLGLVEASNVARAFKSGGLTAGDIGEIGNAEGDFQVVHANNLDLSPSTPIWKAIWDGGVYGEPFTATAAWVARRAREVLPGHPILLVNGSQSGGNNILSCLNDSETTWGFPGTKTLWATAMGDGNKLGLWVQNHGNPTNIVSEAEVWQATNFGIDRVTGLPIAGVTNPGFFSSPGYPAAAGTYNYIVAEMVPSMEPLASGHTAFVQRKSGAGSSTDWGAYDLTSRTLSRDFMMQSRTDYPTRIAPLGSVYPASDNRQEVTGSDIGVHFVTDNTSGMPRRIEYMWFEAMRAAGLLSNSYPEWVVDEWHADYVKLHVEMDGVTVPVTTRYRLAGGTTNFPANPVSAPGTPGAADVLGFMEAGLAASATVQIVDLVTGLPATSGAIKVFPNAGAGTNTSGSKCYVGVNGAGLPVATPIGTGAWMTAGATGEGALDHLPVIKFPVPGDYYVHVPTPVNIEAINDANDLTSLFGIDYYADIPETALSTIYRLPNPTTPNTDYITIDAVIEAATGSESTRVLSVNTNASRGSFRVTSNGAVVFEMCTNTSGAWIFRCQTPDGVVGDGTVKRIRVTAKRTSSSAGDVRCWVDSGAGFVSQDGGTPAANVAFGTARTWSQTGTFANAGNNGAYFHIGQNSVTDGGKLGMMAVFQGLAYEDTSDHDPLTASLYVRANAAETGFEKWNGSAWVAI